MVDGIIQESKSKFGIKDRKKFTELDYCNRMTVFKQEYNKLCKIYDLPTIEKLNEDFDITDGDTNFETILRDVRKAMVVKISGFLNFIELILNPVSGQMFNIFLSRGVGEHEKEIFNFLFDKIGGILVSAILLDIEYNEEKEAIFIKSTFDEWQKIKKDTYPVIKALEENWGKTNSKKQKSYFG